MTTVTFDTRKAVRNLQAAGFAEVQADAMVDTLAEAFTDTVASKADIDKLEASSKADTAEVRADLKADIAEVRADLKADIAEVRAEIGRLEGRVFRALWIQGAGIVGLVVGLTKLL